MSHALGHAVIIMVITPQGTPLVQEPTKSRPIYWKLPAGRCEPDEEVSACAARELEEETGVSLPPEALTFIDYEHRHTHIMNIFAVRLTSLPKLKDRGDEGEIIKVFPTSEILHLADFHPDQRHIVDKVLNIIR